VALGHGVRSLALRVDGIESPGAYVEYRDIAPATKLSARTRSGRFMGVPFDTSHGTIIVFTLDTRRFIQTRDYKVLGGSSPTSTRTAAPEATVSALQVDEVGGESGIDDLDDNNEPQLDEDDDSVDDMAADEHDVVADSVDDMAADEYDDAADGFGAAGDMQPQMQGLPPPNPQLHHHHLARCSRPACGCICAPRGRHATQRRTARRSIRYRLRGAYTLHLRPDLRVTPARSSPLPLRPAALRRHDIGGSTPSRHHHQRHRRYHVAAAVWRTSSSSRPARLCRCMVRIIVVRLLRRTPSSSPSTPLAVWRTS
jgi:hypothetical protein